MLFYSVVVFYEEDTFFASRMSEAEINEVAEALRSGWITTGPKTKEFERLIALCCQTEQAVCLNSATACRS